MASIELDDGLYEQLNAAAASVGTPVPQLVHNALALVVSSIASAPADRTPTHHSPTFDVLEYFDRHTGHHPT